MDWDCVLGLWLGIGIKILDWDCGLGLWIRRIRMILFRKYKCKWCNKNELKYIM